MSPVISSSAAPGGPVHGPVFQNVQLRQMDIQVRDAEGKPVAETEYGKTIHARSLRPPRISDSKTPGKLTGGPIGGAIMTALQPGGTVTEESDLCKEFDLSKPGTYTVQALNRSRDPDTGRIVTSNKVTFTITE